MGHRLLAASLTLWTLSVVGCHAASRQYVAKVKLEKLEIDQRGAHGEPITIDVTLEFPDCPGDQLKTVRGGAEFAQCLQSHKAGETVEAGLHWGPVVDGYDFEVTEIAGCKRPPDADDESGHEIIQVCKDVEAHGVRIGFFCDRKPSKELLAKCPYFRTR
jgi:hypothetical protein